MNAKTRTVASIVVAAVLAVWFMVASFQLFRQLKEASEARSHVSEVLEAADELIAVLRDAETAQRSYALTGDESFLVPFQADQNIVRGRLEKLLRLTRNSPAQARLGAIAPLVDTKLKEMNAVIKMRLEKRLPLKLSLLGISTEKRSMDAIRTELNAYIQVERGVQAHIEAVIRSTMLRLFTFILLVGLLMLLVALSVLALIHRESKHLREKRVHVETQQSLSNEEEANHHLKSTLETLRISEEKLAVTLDSIGDAVIATDALGNVTLMNPRAEGLTGWSQEEARGRAIGEVIHVIHRETRRSSVLPVLAAIAQGLKQNLAKDTVLVARNGREFTIADSCAPILDRGGLAIGAVLVFRDVSAEYAAQQATQESTALIQTILNSVVDGIITIRATDATIESVNPAGARMFGYAPAELVGRNVSLVMPELDRERNRGLLEDYSASDKEGAIAVAHEVEGRKKQGSNFPLEIAICDMKLGGNGFFTGIFRDISARKMEEEALLKSSALQKAIFNSAHFSSIATDSRGVIQVFNVGAERMLGYNALDVVNKITPVDISDSQEVIARAKSLSLEMGMTITPGFEALVFKASRDIEDIYELTYIRKDGSRFPAIVSVTALRDDHGGIIGFLLIGTDNTAQKLIGMDNTARKLFEAEQTRLGQKLRDRQFYARSLFESNVDALMTTDPTGFITDINKQMETLTGCSRDELIGTPFKGHFTNPERAEAAIQQVLREEKITNYELTAHARNGKETVVSFNATTFFDRDRTLQGVFGAARDITEAKQLDLVLQEKNIELEVARYAADKANQAKSEFLSSMSHELRSPLNAILGFTQLIASGPVPPTVSQRESLGEILQAGWHLLKLIDQILDLAKIESGQLPLSHEPVSLAEVMHECQSLVEHQAIQRSIKIAFPSFAEPCFVRADHTRVKQVVINLLSNAIKYNVHHGSVDVACTEVSAGRIRVSIRDTGAGLCPEQLGQLFQAFNRLGQEAGREEGTGIGLVVAKRLVEAMGGVIGAESTIGVGSVFWFELLATEGPRLLEKTANPMRTELGKVACRSRLHTVLYVEDNPANMKLVKQIFSLHPDLCLLTAETGSSGIELAREHLPDLILMDINLPDITGFDALQVLQADPATADILVVALSANAMPLDIDRAQRAGFFRYLTKPIKLEEFMEALEDAFTFSDHKPCRKDVATLLP